MRSSAQSSFHTFYAVQIDEAYCLGLDKKGGKQECLQSLVSKAVV